MKKSLLILTLLFLLTSCAEAFLAGVGGAGIVMVREKSVKDTKDDLLIESNIDRKLITEGLKSPVNKIGVSVNEQRVLLTGIVDDEKIIKKANKIAWETKGVKEVIDEIQLTKNKKLSKNFGHYLMDTAITTQIKFKLLFTKNISSVNFEVITINKVVYIMGITKNRREMNKVNNIAAKTSGVKKVISHIVLQRDKRRKG